MVWRHGQERSARRAGRSSWRPIRPSEASISSCLPVGSCGARSWTNTAKPFRARASDALQVEYVGDRLVAREVTVAATDGRSGQLPTVGPVRGHISRPARRLTASSQERASRTTYATLYYPGSPTVAGATADRAARGQHGQHRLCAGDADQCQRGRSGWRRAARRRHGTADRGPAAGLGVLAENWRDPARRDVHDSACSAWQLRTAGPRRWTRTDWPVRGTGSIGRFESRARHHEDLAWHDGRGDGCLLEGGVARSIQSPLAARPDRTRRPRARRADDGGHRQHGVLPHRTLRPDRVQPAAGVG